MKHLLLASLFLSGLLAAPAIGFAQQSKKIIDHADVQRWKKIEQQRTTSDGQWVSWVQMPVTEGDADLYLWNAGKQQTTTFPRASDAQFSADNKLLIFTIKPALDSLKAQRRKKVKEEDLPKDTLGILTLATGQLEKIPRLKKVLVPEKWSGWLAFQCEAPKPTPAKKDTSKTQPKPAPKMAKEKKEDKDNGYRLVVRNTSSGKQDTIAYVKEFTVAKNSAQLLLYSTGWGDTMTVPTNRAVQKNGVYLYDLGQASLRALYRSKGKFQQLSLDEQGAQAAFLADLDTSKARIRPLQLCYWESGKDSAKIIARPESDFLQRTKAEANWVISEHSRPVFSEDGSKLYFGTAPAPILNDTTLLKEEVVEVEVWNWMDNRLYTQQEVQLEGMRKRAYPVVWHCRKNSFVPLASPEIPELRFQEQRNAEMALAFTEEPYGQYVTTEGTAHKDLYAIDLKSGDKKLIVKDLRCNPRISPEAKYVIWWSDPDTAWFAWSARRTEIVRLTDHRTALFYDEENDVPDFPSEYGMAGWLSDDSALIVYDKYDLWKLDPNGKKSPERLTKGREMQTTYRYLKLDPEERSIPADASILLHQFQEQTKAEGYSWLSLKTEKLSQLSGGDFAYTKQPIKPRKADYLLFYRANFQVFPDLQYLNYGNIDAKPIMLSNANPQQNEYRWGTIEPVQWTSLSGEKLSGLLIKPENFDPASQYPMIVNFYEKLSDGLHQHRSPDFHRSQINYTVYASKGYLVFAPDIPYRTGYPGESAYNAIVSGVTALIDKGFVDPKRVALQGHSWGGYQAAYIVTRTNLFVCAEAGAPVANMTSAYGGIRWESGLSRAFQYEHQQSRIGGSLWEYPMRYLENSPLFALDKVQTPVLILHNDKDGAVPWYQGIELFSGLRRLGKPSWLLNYNDEPHWPVKLQNRIDFQRRMQQFFDHYLMDAPQPRWMKRGVPPIEKGILQGLETDD